MELNITIILQYVTYGEGRNRYAALHIMFKARHNRYAAVCHVLYGAERNSNAAIYHVWSWT